VGEGTLHGEDGGRRYVILPGRIVGGEQGEELGEDRAGPVRGLHPHPRVWLRKVGCDEPFLLEVLGDCQHREAEVHPAAEVVEDLEVRAKKAGGDVVVHPDVQHDADARRTEECGEGLEPETLEPVEGAFLRYSHQAEELIVRLQAVLDQEFRRRHHYDEAFDEGDHVLAVRRDFVGVEHGEGREHREARVLRLRDHGAREPGPLHGGLWDRHSVEYKIVAFAAAVAARIIAGGRPCWLDGLTADVNADHRGAST